MLAWEGGGVWYTSLRSVREGLYLWPGLLKGRVHERNGETRHGGEESRKQCGNDS